MYDNSVEIIWQPWLKCRIVYSSKSADGQTTCGSAADCSFFGHSAFTRLSHSYNLTVLGRKVFRRGLGPPIASHSEALRVLDKDSTTAFLDLEWDGSLKGRVHISLSPDTPLAQQFRTLCTGDQGPTYAQTKIFGVGYKGQDSEYIKGGDYMSNDGSGNTALMEGLNVNDPVYERVGEAGAVWAANSTKLAQFIITTGKGTTNKFLGGFGKVKDGMNVLRSAVERIERVNDVMVVKCGIILPL
ncbi:peptidyl-prolyl cis-trans isomerase-like [Palaemon carinicauda]|uniref:peptidyl-prolyl cis-trans isomerase-like n=1 Tax=Palaemon carinicauda TaxID=392227 RepID=UPI0035B60046